VPDVRFRVLGPLEVVRDERPVTPSGTRLRSLLVALIVEAGNVVSLDKLTETVWGEQPPADPRNAVQTGVARLRERLGDDAPVVTRSPGYALDVDAGQVDALRFEQLLREVRDHPDDPVRARAGLDEALALWRGPAYDGFADDIARSAARRLEEQRLLALEERARARLLLGGDDELPGELAALLAEHPLREGFVELHMRALARLDRTREALAVYRTHRDRLAEETGLDPSAALRELEGRILRGEPLTDERSPASPVAAPSPRLAVTSRPTVPELRPSIPRVTTSLAGRREEIASIGDALARSGLVTLVGTGGVGKTRLATEIATAVLDVDLDEPPSPQRRPPRASPTEVAWIALASLTDPRAVDHAVATTLGIDPGRGRSPREAILELLPERRLLLVLDNAEHLIDAVAPLVEQLRTRGTRLRILVTSRERLAVDGEHVIPVAPLPVEDPDTSGRPSAAVQLFLDRAARAGGIPRGAASRIDGDDDHDHDLEARQLPLTLIARICRQLDGLPLAIELAAARTGALPLEALSEALEADDPAVVGSRRTRHERHRDLWAVTDWSYRLLDAEEQRLFARLSVFAGAFGVEEAHAVAAPQGQARTTTIRQLGALTERSLLARTEDGTDRYRLLRPLRSFARQRLADDGMATLLAERHVRFVVARVEQATSACELADHLWIEQHLDDVRAAYHRARVTGDLDLSIRLVGATYWFDQWRAGGELLGWAEDLCDLDGIDRHPGASMVHAAAAAAAWVRGDLTLAGRRAAHAVTLGEGADDPGRALAFSAQGDVAFFEGRFEDAESACREQARLGRIGGDADNEVLGLAGAAMALAYRGRTAAAVALADAAHRLADRVCPSTRAFVRYAQGETRAEVSPDEAIALLEEAIERATEAHAVFIEDVARLTATSLRGRHGEPSAALPAFAELIEHWRRRGNGLQQWTTLRNLVTLLSRVEADGAAVTIAAAAGAHDRAPPSFGAEQRRLQAALRTAHRRLGDERFAAEQAAGRALDAREAVDRALTEIARLME
jgi:predicted ATPase/DNA-binding SARP family transcriptional activator